MLKLIFEQDSIKVEVYNLLLRDPKNRAYIQKKTSIIDNPNSLFSNIASKNSINQRITLSPGRDHLSNNKGIVTNTLPYQGEFIDDSNLQNALNPNNY